MAYSLADITTGIGCERMGDPEMHLPRARNEVNINTIIQLAGFLLLIGGLGVSYGQLTGQIERQEVTVEQHAVKIDVLRAEMNQIDNLRYRVTAVEQSQTQLSKSVQELKVILNEQRADMRVVREILGRLESTLNETREQAAR